MRDKKTARKHPLEYQERFDENVPTPATNDVQFWERVAANLKDEGDIDIHSMEFLRQV
jgi:hypothetical protein